MSHIRLMISDSYEAAVIVCVCRSRSLRGWRPSTTVQLITQTSWRSARGRWSWWRGRRTASGGWVTRSLQSDFWQIRIWVCSRAQTCGSRCFRSVTLTASRPDEECFPSPSFTSSQTDVSSVWAETFRRKGSAAAPQSFWFHRTASDLWPESCRIVFIALSLQTSCFLSVLSLNSQNFILNSRITQTCQTEFWGTRRRLWSRCYRCCLNGSSCPQTV